MPIEKNDMKEGILETHDALVAEDKDSKELNLTDLAVMLWRARGLVAGITILAMVLTLTTAILTGKYKSEGFFQFGGAIPIMPVADKLAKEPPPGIALSNYKRYEAVYNSAEKYSDFYVQNKLAGDVSAESLLQKINSREGISNLIEPIFPFTKLDAKKLGMESNKDESNNVIGLRINYVATTPDMARSAVLLLGRYVMDAIIYQNYSDMLRFKDIEISTKITKLDNDIIEQNEKLEELVRKNRELKSIISRYPVSTEQGARQVVSVTEETARYLSPTAQLTTNEVEVAETKEKLIKIRRDKTQTVILGEYFGKTKDMLNGTKSGESVLRGLEPIKIATFKDKDLDNEVIKEVFNRITIENQTASSLYLQKSRFIAGPDLPQHRTTSLLIALLTGLALGFILAVGVVGGRLWWKNNSLKLQK
ncbi:lipopolysaccharide biosynthesis protein [Janthinobacterium sp. GMG1]|uniref:lipopolysaccharide biosynthesis protein n=1 Tax=Janthinobacterium sp. GMG1 TaxID=3096007 RepID=UPI002ACA33FD|nr:lipopolysaccharide biosynthesis protein [Janthinobacterium sp. GMG1]MDZ5632381.1 lipopolysaccharide biosynthesis protein [Janthinobacterium sp. GMG1]